MNMFENITKQYIMKRRIVTMDKIKKILKEIRPDIDLECKTLANDGVLDSFDIVTLISELIAEFDVEINVEDIVPENFNSVEAIYNLVERLK